MIDMSEGGAAAFEGLLQFVYLTPVGIVKFRADGTVDLINPMAAQLLLALAAASRLDNFYTAVAPLATDLHREVEQFTEQAGCIVDQRRLDAKVGDKAQVLSLTVNRVSEAVYMAVLKDITKITEQERELFADRQRFRAIFDHVRDYAIYTINLSGIIDDWNLSLKRLGGWTYGDVQGCHIGIFFPEDDPGLPQPDMLLAEAQRTGSVEAEGWRLKRDGSRLWESTVITALPDESGAVRGFVVVARDMTARKRMEDELKALATTDPLTGAFNRRHGQAELAEAFARRATVGESCAVLMLDVDHFKSINDQFGHEAGDTVLCALVLTCKAVLRPRDMVARWGGEEFLILMPGEGAAEAQAVAERLREAVAATRVPTDHHGSIAFTISIGVATPQSGDLHDLLRRADGALYLAKSNGRNRVVFSS